MKIRFSIATKLIMGISVIIVAILINSYLINKSLKKSRKINQKVSNMLLRQLKQKVEIAENGRAAVEKMKEKPFDVVFMDIHMPLMDGYEATEKIRELEQENNRAASYIVAVTANAVPEDKEKCLNIGMNDYITKPFKKETLVSLFNSLSEKGDEKNE